MSELDYETKRWEREVDAEAARLVREGVSPYEAVVRARKLVEYRRGHASGKRFGLYGCER